MLLNFSVKNYRNLRIDQLDFRHINVLIGPNHSGKSNFIEAISFFSDMLLSENKINESAFLYEISVRGWDELLDRTLGKPGKIEMRWALQTSKDYQPLAYALHYNIANADQVSKGFTIALEKLGYDKPTEGHDTPFEFFQCHDSILGKGKFSVWENTDKQKGKRKAPTFDVNEHETVFRQLDSLLDSKEFRENYYPNFIPTVRQVRDFFQRFKTYSSTEFAIKSLNSPQDFRIGEKYLDRDGSNFVNVLSHLENTYDFLDTYTKYVREFMPKLEKIKITDFTDKKKDLQFVVAGKRFSLKEMSDGTKKMLLLALLLWTPETMSILAIDEPELNIHPAWLKVLGNWLNRSESAQQLFISTHSPDLLDTFTELYKEDKLGLLVFQATDETEHTINVSRGEKLAHYFEEGWELGDLYRIGEPRLGGWPW